MTKSAVLAAQKAAEIRQSRDMNVKSEVGFKLKQFTDIQAKVTTARRPSPGKTNQTVATIDVQSTHSKAANPEASATGSVLGTPMSIRSKKEETQRSMGGAFQ